MTVAYIAGPMSSIPDFNYPAFHAAAAQLRKEHPDWTVLNPAENFGGDQTLPWETYLRTAVQQVATADVICLLPGWSESKGARLEYRVAAALGAQVAYLMGAEQRDVVDGRYIHEDGDKPPTFVDDRFEPVSESIAQEAHRIVHGARQQSYGHPLDNFTHTGRLWAPILGLDQVTAEQVALCMVAVKISRECHRPARDNRVDGAGYFTTLDLIAEARRP